MPKTDMNALIRRALGQTVEQLEEEQEEGGPDMNARIRAARGIEVKEKE
jgi:hypothetical protein